MFRRDPEGRDRGPRLLQDLAAQRHQHHVAPGSSRDGASGSSSNSRDDRDHAVGPVAVDRVDAHAQHRADVADLLRVPRERAARRSDGTARRGPRSSRVWCMFIASIPISRQVVRVALERDLDRPAAGRVHELDRGLGARAGGARRGRGADPQPLERAVLPRRPPSDGRPPRSPSRRPSTRRRCRARRTRRPGAARRARRARAAVAPAICGAGACRRRTVGSWAHTTSPSAVSHTSVSRPAAPAARARRNAGSVFSGSSAARRGGRT